MESRFKLNNQHPKLVIDFILQRYGLDLEFEFSIYEDVPGASNEGRRLIRISGKEIDDALVVDMIRNLPPGRELALNSRVRARGNVWHIPMVDLSTSALAQVQKLSAVLSSEIFESMAWFASGRSFHGYGFFLIEENQWVQLMGQLLLVNRPGYPAIVDPRWIGHRLVAGYSSLRWSRNTEKYLHPPVLAAGLSGALLYKS